MALKHVLYFNLGTASWTEVWYTSGSDPVGFQNSLPTSFFMKCMAMRAPNVRLRAMRSSRTEAPKLSSLFPLSYFGGSAAITTVPDTPSVAAYYQIQGTNGKKRILALRGLVDSQVAYNLDGSGGDFYGFLDPLIKAYIDAWIGQSAAVRSEDRVQSSTNKVAFVTSVSPHTAVPNWSQIVISPDIFASVTLPTPATFVGTPKNDIPGFAVHMPIIGRVDAGSGLI